MKYISTTAICIIILAAFFSHTTRASNQHPTKKATKTLFHKQNRNVFTNPIIPINCSPASILCFADSMYKEIVLSEPYIIYNKQFAKIYKTKFSNLLKQHHLESFVKIIMQFLGSYRTISYTAQIGNNTSALKDKEISNLLLKCNKESIINLTKDVNAWSLQRKWNESKDKQKLTILVCCNIMFNGKLCSSATIIEDPNAQQITSIVRPMKQIQAKKKKFVVSCRTESPFLKERQFNLLKGKYQAEELPYCELQRTTQKWQWIKVPPYDDHKVLACQYIYRYNQQQRSSFVHL